MARPASSRRKAEPALAADVGRARAPGVRTSPADRRAAILAVATKMFAEHGFEATTVRQIADGVNILSGSLYHHFETKEEMLHEIVREPVLQMKANTLRIAKAPVDAEQRLVALILLDLGELTRNQEAHSIIFNERRLFRTREEFAYVLQAKRDSYIAWRSVLQDGIDAGLFKPDLDLYLTVSTVVRMLNMAADWYANEPSSTAGPGGAYTLDRVIDFHLSFVMGAVRTPARAGAPIPREACQDLAAFQT